MLPKPTPSRASGDRAPGADERRCGGEDDNVIVSTNDGRCRPFARPFQAPSRKQRPMKCAICRQPSMPGQRLCAPCKSALKRARDTTVSEAIVPLRRARRRPPRDVAASPESAASAAPASPTRASWAGLAAWGGVVAVVFVAGGTWLAHTRGDAAAIAPRHSVGPSDSSAETIKAAANAEAQFAPSPAAVRATWQAATVDTPRAPIDPHTMPASIAVPRGAGNASSDALPRPSSAPPARGAATDPGLGAFPAESPAPAPIVVAQAPAPRPVPDRWQRLAEALNRCPANDVITRTVCQETLRIEQCEGYWGRVAPCPARPEREYGN